MSVPSPFLIVCKAVLTSDMTLSQYTAHLLLGKMRIISVCEVLQFMGQSQVMDSKFSPVLEMIFRVLLLKLDAFF